jgi:hypothetical protein
MVTENELEKVAEPEAPAAEINEVKPDEEPLDRELEAKDAAIVKQQLELAGKEIEIASLKQAIDEARGQSAGLAEKLAGAVAAYREMVIQANHTVLADMITGDSIEKINDSLTGARAVMDKARREIEAEVARARVPAGAPQRMPPDMSALSAHEKIQYGLGGG